MNKKKLFLISFVFTFLFLLSPIYRYNEGQVLQASNGNTIVLPNPGNNNDIQPSLQNAINSALDGDTIILPKGEFLVRKQVEIRKFVSIRGQGKNGGGTKLYRPEDLSDETMETWPYRNIFYINCNSNTPSNIVVSDIYFKGKNPSLVLGDGGSEVSDYAIRIKCLDFVVTNNKFEHFGHAAIGVDHWDAQAGGLVYNNTFIDNLKRSTKESRGTTTGYGLVMGGDNESWADDPRFGTDNFIFVEDNYFIGHRHAIAGGGGGLYVFRHNEVVNNLVNQAVDAHGVAYGNVISTRAYEVYNNNLYNNVYADGITPLDNPPPTTRNLCWKTTYTAMSFRGGEGLIFNNTIRGYRVGIRIITEDTLYHKEKDEYPEYCQIGYLSGLNLGPNHSGINDAQSDGDIFIWDNNFTPFPDCDADQVGEFQNSGSDFLLQENRDFHLNTPKPNYTAYEYPHPLRRLYDDLNSLYDLNNDGSVNISDLLILLQNWGLSSFSAGDFDNSGKIDVKDLLLLLANWGG